MEIEAPPSRAFTQSQPGVLQVSAGNKQAPPMPTSTSGAKVEAVFEDPFPEDLEFLLPGECNHSTGGKIPPDLQCVYQPGNPEDPNYAGDVEEDYSPIQSIESFRRLITSPVCQTAEPDDDYFPIQSIENRRLTNEVCQPAEREDVYSHTQSCENLPRPADPDVDLDKILRMLATAPNFRSATPRTYSASLRLQIQRMFIYLQKVIACVALRTQEIVFISLCGFMGDRVGLQIRIWWVVRTAY